MTKMRSFVSDWLYQMHTSPCTARTCKIGRHDGARFHDLVTFQNVVSTVLHFHFQAIGAAVTTYVSNAFKTVSALFFCSSCPSSVNNRFFSSFKSISSEYSNDLT